MPLPLLRRPEFHADDARRLVMVSDLHVWGPEDPLCRGLTRFVREELQTGDAFFIVGDLFDIFIGTKQVFTEKYCDLFGALRDAATRGVTVYYLEGNHDFDLKHSFVGCEGVRVLQDEFIVNWDGRRVLFSHGDRINPHDYGYKAWRLALHNPLTKLIIAAAPGDFVSQVGVKLSGASRAYNPEADQETVRLFRNYACEQITKGCDFVVMGHSHYLDDIKFKCGDHKGQYVNNGFPRRDHRYLVIDRGEPYIRLESWRNFILPTGP
jgi:UDP-2,3-diacylglucosamine hydrolase